MENKRKYKLTFNFDYIDKNIKIKDILINESIKAIQDYLSKIEQKE